MKVSMRLFVLTAIPFLSACSRGDREPEKVVMAQKINVPKNIAVAESEKVAPLKLRELTDVESQRLDEIETFLTTYTGNNTYNYGSIDRFTEGLRLDPKGILDGADESERSYAQDYIDNKLDFFTRAMVAREINRKGEEQIKQFLVEMGVDTKTGDSPDVSEVKEYVTRDILLEFGDNARVLKAMMEKDHGVKIDFKNGIDLNLLSFVRERKTGLPKGVEVKTVNPQLVVKP
ncbi:MAG: hypothetical protein A3B68_03330 [Candidatus Melainabacteria bacterium RIFCSPHIGHO2_02_FULL_34_12]|nr:MAG: hypothetical protein A3B68_03330 [Candidatus Melainabacteria bacterium RIFCSPHIGHO2_02_FULL_34_12]